MFHAFLERELESYIPIFHINDITNALIKVREEKIRLESSIPRKLEDGWDPMIKIKLNNFSCFALCDVGASTTLCPKECMICLN